MYVYGKFDLDSVRMWGLMTNSNYVLGPGFKEMESPYTSRKRIIQEALSDYNIQKEKDSGSFVRLQENDSWSSVRLQHPERE